MKKLQAQLKELQQLVEDEQRGRDEARDAASKAERRAGELNSEVENTRAAQEQVSGFSFTTIRFDELIVSLPMAHTIFFDSLKHFTVT